MAIERLCICDWANRDQRDVDIREPSWAQVEAAILALNNRNLNDLYLTPRESSPETYLGVGGGAGRYLVTGAIGKETFPTLVNSASSDDTMVPLVVGGQLGDYPARWLVTLEDALRATRLFYDAGGFDCTVEWAYPLG